MGRSIPIIGLYGNLLVSIQIELSDRLILELKDDIAREIRKAEVHGLVVEVQTILAGLNAGMAITLVEMGMNLEGVQTALTLESALDLPACLRRREAVHDAGGAGQPRRAPGHERSSADKIAPVDREADRLLAAVAQDDDDLLFAGAE